MALERLRPTLEKGVVISPELKPNSDADMAQRLYTSTRARKDRSIGLLGDDLLEGAGDLGAVNREGQPLGADGTPLLTFVGAENPDGWHPYLGTAAEGINGPTKQTASELPITRSSWLGNQPPIRGDLPPVDLAAARIPRPEAPLLVAEAVGIEGYPSSTLSQPLFVRYTYVRDQRHSGPSPSTVVPPLSNGQSIKVKLPSNVSEGVTHIGVWLTEPGTSTSTTPGPFYLQREVDISVYNPGTYELTGPYRYEKPDSTFNETLLPTADKPFLGISRTGKASRPGTYYAQVTWSDENGEALPSPSSASVQIVPSSAYKNDQGKPIAGSAELTILRPGTPPDGATGWRPYIYVDGQWNAVYDSYRVWGNEVPYPLSVGSVSFAGWGSASDSQWSTNETVFLVSRNLPTTNTSGLPAPTEALEEPVVFGVVRPPAGTYHAGITETFRGRESVLSPTSSITITANQIPRIVRRDRVNLVPNGYHTEIGANGLPLDRTYVQTGGVITTDGGDLVMETSTPTTGTTPSATTRPVDINLNEGGFVDVHMIAENPSTGVFSGSVETVLQEISDTGVITETVLGSLSSPGELLVQAALLPPGA